MSLLRCESGSDLRLETFAIAMSFERRSLIIKITMRRFIIVAVNRGTLRKIVSERLLCWIDVAVCSSE